LDYCASLKNLQRIKDKPNYKFVQVSDACFTASLLLLLEKTVVADIVVEIYFLWAEYVDPFDRPSYFVWAWDQLGAMLDCML